MARNVRATPAIARAKETSKRKKPAAPETMVRSRVTIQRGFHHQGFELLVVTPDMSIHVYISKMCLKIFALIERIREVFDRKRKIQKIANL